MILNKKVLLKSLKRDKVLYLMLFFPVLLILAFRYLPLFGVIIAFKNYKPMMQNPILAFFNSEWVGFRFFNSFFESQYFWQLLRNTLLISLYSLVFAFPAPIILALSLNEVKNQTFKRITQSISYLPHFISTVVVVGIVTQLLSPSTGLINMILKSLGMETIYFMTRPEWFRTIYILSDIWTSVGWGSIIYLAALTAIDVQLYEAATIDGAGRWKKMLHITLPGITPTIVTLLLLRVGHVLDTGFEKVILMYNPLISSTAEVFDSYVYRRGLGEGNAYSYTTAVGLFKSIVGLVLLMFVNRVSKKLTDTSLW